LYISEVNKVKKYPVAVLCIVIFAGIAGIFAQTPSNPVDPRNPLPDWVINNQRRKDELDRATKRDPARNVMITLPSERGRGRMLPDMQPLTPEELELLRAEANGYEAKYGVPRSYRKKFEAVLNLDNTGMTRIFPNKNCGEGKVVTLAELERCADVPDTRNGGSIFSFRCRVDNLSGCNVKLRGDLKLEGNKFLAGDGVVQGMIADIGDVDILSVDPAHKALQYMDDYNPKQSLPEIAAQDKKLAKGIKARGYTFTNAAPLKLNSTYVLRSVLYRHHDKGALSAPLNGTDVRIVFKLVGREPDGSVLVLWRELDRQFPRRKISD
jgi:hypothetical protein